MSQNHFTLGFPLKSPADAKALAEQLPPLMPGLFQAEDVIGTIHYSRFTVLSEKTLLFLGDFDGEFGQLMADLAKHAGPVFDAIFQHVDAPPPTPVADQCGRFRRMERGASCPCSKSLHRLPRRDCQGDQGVGGSSRRHRCRRATPIPGGPAHQIETCLRRGSTDPACQGTRHNADLDKVGTPHFAQFVPLEDNQIGFFTVYDGSFEKYIADFTKNIGPIFDLLFKFTKGAPPSPCRKHLQEFIDFAAGANRTPIGFYQAYPGLTVQDIHALIADSKSESGSAA